MTPDRLHLLSAHRHRIPVDGHVHFHRLEQAAPTLHAAAQNFRAAAGSEAGCLGALLLTEAPGERIFSKLSRQSALGGWRVAPCSAEKQSVICHCSDGWIIVVCGRQIPCERGLEVAALGTTEEFPERRPLEETILRVQESGALTVIPWGFGKWMGTRGTVVREALNRHDPAELAVGDNGGRLEWTGRPVLLRAAAERGYRVVPGTDPFPFGKDFRRVGTFGFLVDVEPSIDAPWEALAGCMVRQQAAAYGPALGPARFLWNQVGMQFYNFAKRRAAAA